MSPEGGTPERERLIKVLLQGHESATELKLQLQNSAEELLALADAVLRSFTHSISALSSSSEAAGSSRGGDGQPGFLLAASTNDLRSEDSTQSSKRSLPPTKDRRGSYKRRKTEQTWTKTSQTTDDDYAWRKYGQKEILNSKFPRSYFRCTKKFDQGCGATKQVQRIQENPDMYNITYIGLHTCNNTLKAPLMITYSNTWNSLLENSKVPNEKEAPSCLQTPTIKQEYPKEDATSDVTDNLDPNLWSDFKDFELSKPSKAIVPIEMASDNADTVYSCTDSQGLDMDFGVFSSHFGTDDFHFDESINYLPYHNYI